MSFPSLIERVPVISPDVPPRPRLLLVDGHAYAYRSFFAIRSLNAPDGSPTNAIFGFIKSLQRLEAALQPSHRLVLWDAGLDVERQSALPGYKANRPPTPEALEKQFPQLEDWLVSAGWGSHKVEGTEADDWIATYARRADKAGWETVIASADKDFLQLVGDRIGLVNPNDKSGKIWTATDVQTKTGVQPDQIVDWLSLVGDAADNIPGVPGVGPKTATDLLLRFRTAGELLARTVELKSENQRAAVQGASGAVRRNQILIRLKDDMEGGPMLEDLVPKPVKASELREKYQRWGFKSLLAELGPEPGAPTQGNLF
ncbi:MAG: hypothetical protein EXS36_18045 [Pedosphaera sp.]|nr:hypothetical protein [Pedosphaera sp.]